MEIEFEFEQLIPVINDRIVTGMMLNGTATLESANPSEPHEFFVSEVVLEGGLVLTPSGNVPRGHHSLTKDLFKAVADIIQNDKHPIGKDAQLEFGSAVDEGEYEDRQYRSSRVLSYIDAGRPVRGASLNEGAGR